MILEAVRLCARSGEAPAFEEAMRTARPLIEASEGFRGLEVRPCLEEPGVYLLLVWWERLEDHTDGFRGSDRYARWKDLLHRFYEPFPTVEHFGPSFLE